LNYDAVASEAAQMICMNVAGCVWGLLVELSCAEAELVALQSLVDRRSQGLPGKFPGRVGWIMGLGTKERWIWLGHSASSGIIR
jgi:hypothetical protein